MSKHAGMVDLADKAADIDGLSIRADQIESIHVTYSYLQKERTTFVRLLSGRQYELKGDLRGEIVEAMKVAES